MSENTVAVEMTLKEAQVWAGLQKLVVEQKKGEEGFEKIAKASRKVADEQKKADEQLTRFAEHTKQLNATPVEKYQQQVNKLNTALAMGKISQDTFSRATAKAREELAAARGATGQLVEEIKQVEIVSEQAFGSDAIAMFGQYAAGIGLATASLAKFKEMLEFAKAQRDAGGASIKSDFDVYASINELVGSDAELSKEIGRYEGLKSKHGLSRETASELWEKAYSSGNLGSVERFAGTRGIGDPAARMAAASRLESLSHGAVNERQADVAIWAAAKPSPFGMGDFAKYVPTASGSMQAQGTGVTELMAAMSVFADQFKGPEMAADRLNNLQTKLSLDKRFQGKGLTAAVQQLQGMPEAERRDFLKDSIELNTAYNKYTENMPEIAKRQKMIEAEMAKVGTANDPVLLGQARFERNKKAGASLEAQRAAQQEEAAQRDTLGLEGVSVENTRRGLRSRALKRGDGAISRFAEDQFAGVADVAGGDAAAVRGAGLAGRAWARSGGTNPFAMWEVLKEEFKAEVEALKANAEATKANTAALNGGGRGRGPNPLGQPKK